MKNKVSFLVITLVLLNFTYNVGLMFEWWPTFKTQNWNSTKGFNLHWDLWVNLNYLNILALGFSNFIKKTRIDEAVLMSFCLFTGLGWLSYEYAGWPEPFDLLVSSFCLSSIIFIFTWKRKS